MALTHKRPPTSVRRAARTAKIRFAVCINNEDYPASLEKRKIYRVLPDPASQTQGLWRIVDESGEDYLYPASWFVPISLSASMVKALALVA